MATVITKYVEDHLMQIGFILNDHDKIFWSAKSIGEDGYVGDTTFYEARRVEEEEDLWEVFEDGRIFCKWSALELANEFLGRKRRASTFMGTRSERRHFVWLFNVNND